MGGTGGKGGGIGSFTFSIGGGPSGSLVPPGVTLFTSFVWWFVGVVGVVLEGTDSQLEVSNSS